MERFTYSQNVRWLVGLVACLWSAYLGIASSSLAAAWSFFSIFLCILGCLGLPGGLGVLIHPQIGLLPRPASLIRPLFLYHICRVSFSKKTSKLRYFQIPSFKLKNKTWGLSPHSNLCPLHHSHAHKCQSLIIIDFDQCVIAVSLGWLNYFEIDI